MHPADHSPTGPHRLVAVNVSGVTAGTEELEAKPVVVPFGKPGRYLPERTGRLTWPVGGGRPEVARRSPGDRPEVDGDPNRVRPGRSGR